MNQIDKKAISAGKTLELLGYTWQGGELWKPPLGKSTEPLLDRITELEALCLNALYHHQGASSAVGQPIRKALGIGEHDRLTEERLEIIQSVRTL